MKLVLDYIYSGAMYLCGAHMQYVIQVEPYLSLPKKNHVMLICCTPVVFLF